MRSAENAGNGNGRRHCRQKLKYFKLHRMGLLANNLCWKCQTETGTFLSGNVNLFILGKSCRVNRDVGAYDGT